MQEKIRRLLTNNLELKLIGLLLAILLWLVLHNMQNPIVERTMSIPLTYENEEWLTENGYCMLTKPSSVTVTVMTRRSNVGKLKVDDFSAQVNLKEYIGQGINEAPETTKFNLVIAKSVTSAYIEDWEYPRNRYVEISIDTVKSAMYPVSFQVLGEVPEGYQAVDIHSNPARVRITGPTSAFSNLVAVKANVNISALTGENSEPIEAPLLLYDGNNRVISSKNLSISQETVQVTVGLGQTKEIGINVSRYSGVPADGYGCASFDYTPKVITVSGTKESLANVSSITIPKSVIDISNATETVNTKINIVEYLPEAITLAEGVSPIIEFTCEIEPLEQRSFAVQTDVFQFIGTNDAYEYEMVTLKAELVLSSFKANLDALRERGIYLKGTINVAGMKPNREGETSFVPVIVSIDSQYTVVDDIMVEIQIKEKELKEELTSEEMISEESSSEETTQKQMAENEMTTEEMTSEEMTSE